jgi:hypothetical protein
MLMTGSSATTALHDAQHGSGGGEMLAHGPVYANTLPPHREHLPIFLVVIPGLSIRPP